MVVEPENRFEIKEIRSSDSRNVHQVTLCKGENKLFSIVIKLISFARGAWKVVVRGADVAHVQCSSDPLNTKHIFNKTWFYVFAAHRDWNHQPERT